MGVSIWTGRSTEHDLNLSNNNFIDLAQYLSIPIDSGQGLVGDVRGDALIALAARIQEKLARMREVYSADELHPPGENGIYRAGLDEVWYRHVRLSELLAICEDAIEIGDAVHFG